MCRDRWLSIAGVGGEVEVEERIAFISISAKPRAPMPRDIQELKSNIDRTEDH
jgi:hypothetical protein